MQIIADKVHPDEPCHGYYCGPRMMPGWPEQVAVRMVEFVFVIRGDAIAKYVRDFGPADEWPYIPPLMMPSFGENTVAEMQEWGERHRHDDRWARKIQEMKEGSTLLKDAVRQIEEMHEVIRNRTNIGPAGIFQRNGYSREFNYRQWNDERHGRSGKIQL